MVWKEFMDEHGGGDISFLSEDEETQTFVVVGKPYLLTGKFKGRESKRVGCPVVTQEGYTLLIVGLRLARRLSRFEGKFDEVAFTVIRHGQHSDIETTYELKICDDTGLTRKLFDLAKTAVDESTIADSVQAAEAIVSG